MAHKLPDFNLSANIWWDTLTNPLWWTLAPDVISPCALVFGGWHTPVSGPPTIYPGTQQVMWRCLYLPKGTDIRNRQQGGQRNSECEVPAGSGRWYYVWDVDDVGKGHANEFRLAYMFPVLRPAPWPTPMP